MVKFANLIQHIFRFHRISDECVQSGEGIVPTFVKLCNENFDEKLFCKNVDNISLKAGGNSQSHKACQNGMMWEINQQPTWKYVSGL